MRVLAVNTASPRLSLALAEGAAQTGTPARIIFSADVEEPRDQGNFLLHTITQNLAENGLKFTDLDVMVAVTGPGSFTGIRIGLAALRGFSLASDVLLAGVTSFTLYAAAVPISTKHRLIAMESWRDELYFQLDNEAPFNVTPHNCLGMLGERNIRAADVTLMGDATAKMQSLLPEAVLQPAAPTATDLAQLMIANPDLGDEALPFYLRPPDVTLATGGRHLQKSSDGA